jgi:hypothetical protein
MARRSVLSVFIVGSLIVSQANLAGCASGEADFPPADSGVGTEGYGDVTSGGGAQFEDPRFAPGLAFSYHRAPGAWSDAPPTALSFEDREAIGRVAYAEAGNQGEEGIAAVIFTILNRVSSGQFQDSIQGVIDAPNQFEPATRVGGWRYLPPLDPTESIQFDTILNLILAGRLPDPTNGAVFFQNARIVSTRAAAGKVSPRLIDFGGTPPIAEIRDHRFYDARAGVNLSASHGRGGAEDSESWSADYPPPSASYEDELTVAAPEAYATAPDLPEESGLQPAPVQDEPLPG